MTILKNLFTKTISEEFIYPVCKGLVHPLEDSRDEVFHDKLMGEGCFIKPDDTTIVAPVDGIIQSIFPTKHALTILSNQGVELMIHVGLDTVSLQGKGFTLLQKEHTKVATGEPILQVDFAYLRDKQLCDEVYICVLNSKDVTLTMADKSKKYLFSCHRKDGKV